MIFFHSTRVWVCVLSSEAGAKPGFIKDHLRRMVDSCCSYLRRDTAESNDQHRDALMKVPEEVMTLLPANLDEALRPEKVLKKTEMEQYANWKLCNRRMLLNLVVCQICS